MQGAKEVEQRRVVGLVVLEEDGETDDEDVGLCGEGVGAGGGD